LGERAAWQAVRSDLFDASLSGQDSEERLAAGMGSISHAYQSRRSGAADGEPVRLRSLFRCAEPSAKAEHRIVLTKPLPRRNQPTRTWI
jgi:hypothetical protein